MDRKIPRTTVIIPLYNCEKNIAAAIHSVLQQTDEDWELIVAENGSTDNSRTVAREAANGDPRIIFLESDINNNSAAVHNSATGISRGRYIAFMGANDIWLPEKLEHQIAFMEKSKAALTATAYEKMEETGSSLGIAQYPPEITDIRKCLLLSNPLGITTIVYDTNMLGKQILPKDALTQTDYELCLLLLHNADCFGIQEVLTKHRILKQETRKNDKAAIRRNWYLYRNIEHMTIPRSLWYLWCWTWGRGTGAGLDIRREDK